MLPMRSRLVADDPRLSLLERAEIDSRFNRVVYFLDKAGNEAPGEEILNADGLYYRDAKSPFMVADQTAITGTSEALMWPSLFSLLPANYFGIAGKMLKITAYGKITTASSSQGNITLTVRYGTSTGGTSIGASTATALVASGTNIPWRLEAYVVCRAPSTTGASTASLFAMGKWETTTAIVASPSTIFIPGSAPAATTVDGTIAAGIVVGCTMGSASDSLTTQILAFEALN